MPGRAATEDSGSRDRLAEPDFSAGSIAVRRSRGTWLRSMRRGELKDLLAAVEEQLDDAAAPKPQERSPVA
jgi:hypothetical protein